jgi:hypothetical protein
VFDDGKLFFADNLMTYRENRIAYLRHIFTDTQTKLFFQINTNHSKERREKKNLRKLEKTLMTRRKEGKKKLYSF